MTPPLINKIPLLNKWQTPLDFGKKLNEKVIFGPNKTWRGLIFGSIFGALVGLLTYNLLPQFSSANIISQSQALMMGFLLGFGALAGDAVESFFKRRADVASGHSWFPFDQTDYILGGLLVSYPFLTPSLGTVLTIFGTYFGLHLVVSYFGYLLGLKDKPI